MISSAIIIELGNDLKVNLRSFIAFNYFKVGIKYLVISSDLRNGINSFISNKRIITLL